MMLFVSLMLTAPLVSSAKEWRGLVPLHSTCEDAKRTLGIEECETGSYQLNGEEVIIYFADVPCRKMGRWNIPLGTVTGITVFPKRRLLLTDFKIQDQKFKKVADVDTPNVNYIDKEEGFIISVSDGEVESLSYFPAAKDSYLRCQDSPPPRPLEEVGESTFVIFDEYNDLCFDKEKKRLDDFAIQLQNDPYRDGYIMAYAGRRARFGEAKERAERAKEYLITKHGIRGERIVITDGGYKEELTVRLLTGAPGSAPPTATPTIHPDDVQIIKDDDAKSAGGRSGQSRCKQ